VDKAIARERQLSPSFGGRTVFDDRRDARRKPASGQLNLFSKRS